MSFSALQLALAALFVPLAATATIGLVPPLRRAGKPAAFLGIAAAATSFLCAASLFQAWFAGGMSPVTAQVDWLQAGGQAFAHLGVHLDGTSVAMLLVVTAVALCVQVFSLGYLHDEPPASLGRYYAWHGLFLFAMSTLVVAPDLLQLFLGWELVGLASYLLIGFWLQKPSAGRAAVKAFWTTKLADVGLGAALVLLFVRTGGFGWDAAAQLSPGDAALVAGLLLIAVMGKSAQFPLHIWLPDAMEGPTPVSALLHAATMVAAGVYLVVRAWPLFAAAPDILELMTYLGAFTALFASVVACVQTDVKKVLAYSTCAQLGYMVAGLGAGSVWGGFFHLFTHAFFKALLFLGAGALIHAVHSNDLGDMGGLWRKLKLSGTAFVIGALALAGAPGLAGFFSKDVILEAMHEGGHTLPWLMLLGAAGLTAFYMTRVVALALLGPAGKHTDHAHEGRLSHGPPDERAYSEPLTMLLPLGLLAVLAVGAGWLGTPLAAMLGQTHAFHLSPTGIAALGLAGLGITFGWLVYGARRLDPARIPGVAALAALARGNAVDDAAQAIYRRGLLTASAGIAWLDRYLVDGLMNLTAFASLKAGEGLRRLQTGQALDYVYAVAVGLLVLAAAGAWAP